MEAIAAAASAGMRQYTSEDISTATGGFHDLALIGQGGFGRVFRAVLGYRPVAIKVQDSGGLQGTAEFENELRLLSTLRHPHLIALLGWSPGSGGGSSGSGGGSSGCGAALIYELMSGGSIDTRLAYQAGRPPLPWCCRIRCAAQAGSALAYLHAQDPPVIHRDVKPANIFIDALANAKLGDVGLAAAARDGALTETRRDGGGEAGLAGEFPYLAPEYRSDGRLSIKTDVYAWGISLLQLATGALENLPALLPRCRTAVAAGRAREVLDPGAGAWDAFAGTQLLCLGLWCASEAPEMRPVMSVAAAELAKLSAAIAAAGAGGCAACCSAASSGGGAALVTGGPPASPVRTHTGNAAPGSPPPRSPGGGGMGSLFGGGGGSANGGAGFWRAGVHG